MPPRSHHTVHRVPPFLRFVMFLLHVLLALEDVPGHTVVDSQLSRREVPPPPIPFPCFLDFPRYVPSWNGIPRWASNLQRIFANRRIDWKGNHVLPLQIRQTDVHGGAYQRKPKQASEEGKRRHLHPSHRHGREEERNEKKVQWCPWLRWTAGPV